MFTISETRLRTCPQAELDRLTKGSRAAWMRISAGKTLTTSSEKRAMSQWQTLHDRCRAEQKRRAELLAMQDTTHAKAMSVSVFGGVE